MVKLDGRTDQIQPARYSHLRQRAHMQTLFLTCLFGSDGADWCVLMPSRVESWVRAACALALGFPLLSLSPDPQELLELRIEKGNTQLNMRRG